MLILLILICGHVYAQPRHTYYMATAQAGAGYLIDLEKSNAGKPNYGDPVGGYYKIGETITLQGYDAGATGRVDCDGKSEYDKEYTWPDTSASWNRFEPIKTDEGTIKGRKFYKINDNFYYTLYTQNPVFMKWLSRATPTCAHFKPRDNIHPNVEYLNMQFPLEIEFFVKKRFADGQLVIPAADLAMYFRVFSEETDPNYLPNVSPAWPISESVPIRLKASVLHFENSCRAMVDNQEGKAIELHHGPLGTSSYSDKKEAIVEYICDFGDKTGITFQVDYDKKGSDPRLPLFKNGNTESDVVYSELTLEGPGGQTTTPDKHQMRIEVGTGKTTTAIKVRSILKGQNAQAGTYRGAGWLIAVFD